MFRRPFRKLMAFFLAATALAYSAYLLAQAPTPKAPFVDVSVSDEEGRAHRLGDTSLSILGTAFWRDWMPTVAQPGPDGGSPLRGTLRFWLDNSNGGATTLTFKLVVVDAKGKSSAVSVHAQPNFHLVPDQARARYRAGDPALKAKLMADYRVVWDGTLKAGESRELDLALSEGPYLPAGSRVRAEVTWTDAKGRTLLTATPENRVKRTD